MSGDMVELDPLRSAVKEQGDLVRSLKADKKPTNEIQLAVLELKARKKKLEDAELKLTSSKDPFDRVKLEDLLKRRFFYDQSFSIYGGVAGLYDFGPVGCAMKSNFLQHWRNHFVIEEGMLEVDCAMLTPEKVLRASGHVDRFADYMVKDLQTGECFRADHLLKAHVEGLLDKHPEKRTEYNECLTMVDNFSKLELGDKLEEFGVVSPVTGNRLGPPIEFNLMFSTSIGPDGYIQGFLRPETAQGIFVNFKRLLEFNQGRLPFAAAQIGSAFRNEISPRSGLIRAREFAMAEIEHFVDPGNKKHPKFERARETEAMFYSRDAQMGGEPARVRSFGDAVHDGTVANETLGYFLARIQGFLVRMGVDPERIRFRQHMGHEMAHYACDCWDAELLTSYGWVECVGCADRSAFDLGCHSRATGTRLVAEVRLPEPRRTDVIEVLPNKPAIGKTYRKDAKRIINSLALMSECDITGLESAISVDGKYSLDIEGVSFDILPDMFRVDRTTKTIHVDEVVPNVIEPSFGIGRCIYAILEHNFRCRPDDEQRCYFSLPALLAPYKCSVLPLSHHEAFRPLVDEISRALAALDVSHKVDDSSVGIGRRYARTDEIAIPYGITVDFDSVKEPHSASLRERDSMEQVRVPVSELATVVQQLSVGRLGWSDVLNKYPKFEAQENIRLDEPK